MIHLQLVTVQRHRQAREEYGVASQSRRVEKCRSTITTGITKKQHIRQSTFLPSNGLLLETMIERVVWNNRVDDHVEIHDMHLCVCED